MKEEVLFINMSKVLKIKKVLKHRVYSLEKVSQTAPVKKTKGCGIFSRTTDESRGKESIDTSETRYMESGTGSIMTFKEYCKKEKDLYHRESRCYVDPVDEEVYFKPYLIIYFDRSETTLYFDSETELKDYVEQRLQIKYY